MTNQLPLMGDLRAPAPMADIALIAEQAVELAAQDAASANAGGGSFNFSPAELQSVLTQWTDLETTISTALRNMDNRRTVLVKTGPIAPGNEQASETVAVATSDSNDAYVTYLTSMRNYAHGFVEKLTTALNLYNETEDANSGRVFGVHSQLKA